MKAGHQPAGPARLSQRTSVGHPSPRRRPRSWAALLPRPCHARSPGACFSRTARLHPDAILERAAFAFSDWMSVLAAPADIEIRMLAVLDQLGLATLVTTVPGLSASGAAGPGI